jgi:DNA-3-methyladenine glycosylase II
MDDCMAYDSIANRNVWRTGSLHLQKNDKIMKSVIKNTEGMYKMKLNKDHYGAVIRSIIFQQISGRAGASILERFKGLYGNSIPTPAEFLATDEKRVRASGISPQKYGYLKDLSERILDGRLELEKFRKMDDEDIVKELDEVKGIGRWTAEMFLIFTLGRVDVMPVDDLGLRNAAKMHYRLKDMPDRDRFTKIAKAWHPYCSIASLYLWKSLEKKKV